jgi:hypothetical protein
MANKSTDFIFENHFSLVILRPVSDAGHAWIEDNIGEDNGYQPMYPSIVIEPRYAQNVLDGIRDADLGVRQ